MHPTLVIQAYRQAHMDADTIKEASKISMVKKGMKHSAIFEKDLQKDDFTNDRELQEGDFTKDKELKGGNFTRDGELWQPCTYTHRG